MLPFLGSSLLPFGILALYSRGPLSVAHRQVSRQSRQRSREEEAKRISPNASLAVTSASDEFLERSSIPCRSLSRSRRTLSVTLPAEHSPPVGNGDAAFGEGLADFGVDLIGGYGAGGAGVDPTRCLASTAAMWTGWCCGHRRTARPES